MPRSKRDAALKMFSEDPHTKVILMSLQAGGVGYVYPGLVKEEPILTCSGSINLTAASRVHLMEPHWSVTLGGCSNFC